MKSNLLGLATKLSQTSSKAELSNPQIPWGRHFFFDKYDTLKSKIKRTKRSQKIFKLHNLNDFF